MEMFPLCYLTSRGASGCVAVGSPCSTGPALVHPAEEGGSGSPTALEQPRSSSKWHLGPHPASAQTSYLGGLWVLHRALNVSDLPLVFSAFA